MLNSCRDRTNISLPHATSYRYFSSNLVLHSNCSCLIVIQVYQKTHVVVFYVQTAFHSRLVDMSVVFPAISYQYCFAKNTSRVPSPVTWIFYSHRGTTRCFGKPDWRRLLEQICYRGQEVLTPQSEFRQVFLACNCWLAFSTSDMKIQGPFSGLPDVILILSCCWMILYLLMLVKIFMYIQEMYDFVAGFLHPCFLCFTFWRINRCLCRR